jgi:hypothetical protein
LLSLGAVAATTTITPAFAEGDDDGVKQKAKAETNCDSQEIDADNVGSISGGPGGGPENCDAIATNANDAAIFGNTFSLP